MEYVKNIIVTAENGDYVKIPVKERPVRDGMTEHDIVVEILDSLGGGYYKITFDVDDVKGT